MFHNEGGTAIFLEVNYNTMLGDDYYVVLGVNNVQSWGFITVLCWELLCCAGVLLFAMQGVNCCEYLVHLYL